MNSQQIALVRQTCTEVAPIADSTAEIFYQKLFQLSPSMRSVFAPGLRERGRQLMETVEAATQIMDHRKAMTSAFAELGSRQMALAAGNNRYEAVGAALILAFRQGLGPSFTPEARQAWIALFDYIDETMKADGNRPTEPSFAAAA